MFEGPCTEFKREYTDSIIKTVVAFANCEGGDIYVGIKDDGAVCGVTEVDKTIQKITNSLRDAICPDITQFSNCICEDVEGKNVIKISVKRGTLRPYYITAKGISPLGVFVRYGASTVSADDMAIFAMLRETAGDSFESARSREQDLTFEQTTRYFEQFNVGLSGQNKQTLHFIGVDGCYTNLAYLMSDQCTYSLKLARFDGTEKAVFQDRQEVTAPLLKQLEAGIAFLESCNRLHSEVGESFFRTDRRDYPVEAVREALLNSVIHREYAYSAPTLVSVFDDRMEFVSVGGLAHGLCKEDIMLGVSLTRNPNLANVFYRLKLIEAYGTGIKKIMDCYATYERKPQFEISPNAFKTTLPNVNYKARTQFGGRVSQPFVMHNATLEKRAGRVLEFCRGKGYATRHDVQELLGVSQATAILLLREMLAKGQLKKSGAGKNSVYIV